MTCSHCGARVEVVDGLTVLHEGDSSPFCPGSRQAPRSVTKVVHVERLNAQLVDEAAEGQREYEKMLLSARWRA